MDASYSPTQISGKHNPIYEAYYAHVDPNGHGIIGAMEAARFLKKSGLSDVVLSRVWDLSDPGGRGCLDKTGMFVALKLVALAQTGRDINMSNITLDMPPPKMGDTPVILPKKLLPPTTTSIIKSLQAPTVDWTIKSPEREKYNKTFESLQPVHGVIPGNKVKGVLMESKLPIETLGQIWELADQDKDGSLNRDEFIAAMHLVYKALEKHAIPNVLPAELIASCLRKNTSVPITSTNNIAGARPNIPPQPPNLLISNLSQVTPMPSTHPLLISRDITNDDSIIINTPLTVATLSTLESGAITSARILAEHGSVLTDHLNWVVSIEEQIKSDMLFVKSDIDRDGFVSGIEIKDVFLQSGVPQSTLAHIWALCDIRRNGKLNSEQFALAMWLVAKCLKGVDPPDALTSDMTPPSFRTNKIENPRSIANNNTSYSNPELDMISKDVEELTGEKMSLEMDITKKETSIRIKSSEIKSLQSELDTLAATLKQLENQKGEAQKRLGDLKSQVDKLRLQASEQTDIISIEEAELLSKKEQLESLKREELRLTESKQKNGETLDGLGLKLQDTQLNISQAKALISQLEEQTKQMKDAIISCETTIDCGDASNITDAILSLNPDFRDSQYSRLGLLNGNAKEIDFSENESDCLNRNANTSEFSVDPFTNDNLGNNFTVYGSSEHFKSTFSNANDPFNRHNVNNAPKMDPFDAFGNGNKTSITPEPDKDAFGCDPFAVLHAPTRDVALDRATSPSPALPPKKAKPPRPAPPRPQPPSINKDGAGGANEQFDGSGFANFANFDDKYLQFSSKSKPGISSPTSNTVIGESDRKLEFTDDPFRDYRYEDPFNIAFEDEVKFGRDHTTSATALAHLTSHPVNVKSFLPASMATGRRSAPLQNVLKYSGIHKDFNSSSGRVSVPLGFEDERSKIEWASKEGLELEQQRQHRLNEQEKDDLKLAIALSKVEIE